MKKANVLLSSSDTKNKKNRIDSKNSIFNRFAFFISARKNWLLLLIIFILCFAALLCQQIFIRKLGVFDELTYYNMAKNIFFENNFKYYGLKTYPLIVYPLLISPFFAIQDSIVRLQSIYIFNSLLFASSVFPIWLICGELKISRKFKYIVILFAVLSPIMTFSYVIMAEALYYPLALWIIVLALYNSKQNKWYLSLLLGVLFYLSYITKSIGAIFFLAYLITSLFMPLFNKICDKNKEKSISEYYNKKNLINLILTFLVFLALDLTFHYTIFNDPSMVDAVDVLSVFQTLFSSFDNFMYIVYWTILFLASFVMSLLILPFIYPIAYFKAINKKAQSIFIFSIVYLVILSFYVAASITFIEEPYELMPNIHLRYTIPNHILIIMVFISLLDSKNAIVVNANTKKHILSFVIPSVIIILLFKGNRFRPVDANFLCLYTAYRDCILSEFATTSQYVIYLIFIVTNIVIVSLIFLLDRFLISRKKCLGSIILISVFSVATLTVGTLQYRVASSGCYEEILEIQKIDKFICNEQGSKVLCLVNDYSLSCFTIEPYITKTDKEFIIETSDYFKESMTMFTEKFDSIKKRIIDIKFSPSYTAKEISVDKIDYILLPTKTILKNFCFEQTSVLPKISGKYFQLLKNIDNNYITINVTQNS